MITIGINGFGRIGRNFLRAAWGRSDMTIAAVNDLTDGATLAHLLKHDSILGAFPHEVAAAQADGGQAGGVAGAQSAGSLMIDGTPVRVFAEKDPARIPWAEASVDIVIESTGRFTDRASAELHLGPAGAKRVIVSAPAKGDDLTVVMGVNDSLYDPTAHRVLSNGSCTTNALAPVALVLNEAFGIEYGLMNTTHAYTNSQVLHDQPEKDLRGARAAALSIVPYSSGAAKAIGKVIPALDGKLTGYSLRVPVPVVSIVDLTVTLARDVTAEEVNAAFKAASEGALRGILGYSEEPLVSCDYLGDPRSSIVDARSTIVIGKRMVKVLSWYDNEWGFSNRLVDLAALIGRKGA
jgi:glyceraldehyde 3-phosphate dehydrogenase